jgi:plastocyanin
MSDQQRRPFVSEHQSTISDRSDVSSWVKLLKWSTIAAIVVVALITVFAGVIPPLIVFAVIWLVGTIWLGRSTRGPAILLLVGFIAFLGLSAPFVLPTLMVPASPGDFILNLASFLAAITGIVAAVFVIRGRLGPSETPRTLARAAIGLFVLGAAVSVFATLTYDGAEALEGDISLITRDIEFQTTSLEGVAGEISVFVENQDATLHTFTIEELDVDLDIPASKSARVTFEAEPGTYRFFCVPHEGDMEGTLVVN